MSNKKNGLVDCQEGIAGVEEVVLVSAVALGAAGAIIALGALLLGYHQAIEFVLAMPVP